MWKDKEAHFGGDYFFKDEAVASTAKVSGVFNLGQTLGGMRIRGWFTEAGADIGGKSITVKVEGAEVEAAEAWTELDSKTVTLLAGKREFYSFIPDTELKFCRVTVTGGSGLSGNFNVAPELIP